MVDGAIRMSGRQSRLRSIAGEVAARYAVHEVVVAVALGGSLAAGALDEGSDIDLYVYHDGDLPMVDRSEVAWSDASYAEVGNAYWEPGDEWITEATGDHVDVMFRATSWIEAQMDRVLVRHEASVGYTTCLWYNVLNAEPLFDRAGWYAALQARARQPYPAPLRQAIVATNHPILRETASSYRYQIEAAVRRGDWVSINHRVAALLASYFDIIFAINGMPNPGEKRLLGSVGAQCTKVPPRMADQVTALIAAVPGDPGVLDRVDALVDGLDDVLRAEGLLRG